MIVENAVLEGPVHSCSHPWSSTEKAIGLIAGMLSTARSNNWCGVNISWS